jgi:eukaryotic-like serine/threonine-protein kinase
MQSKRWQTCMDVFNAAVEQSPDQRAAFLERSCDGDEALRRKIELLLKYHDKSGDFIKSPAFEAAPELLAADPETLIGRNLGCYRVDAVAGVGGMGIVYLAWDERLGRKVALKLLPESMVANEAQLARLKREARTASALNHPNIVTIHDIGEVGSIHYVAAEFIEGTTLRERMMKGPIQPNEAVDIAAQVASALCVAHRAGVVHRDIKPENIMLRPDGYVKVLDFGIAKLTQQETLGITTLLGAQLPTQQSMMLGTTRYMSPEQAMAQQVDARSDLWSLGVVLYEMLAGRAPFEGETAADVMTAILGRDPPPLKHRVPLVPPALQRVVDRSLRKDPAERYQTAEEMLSELRAIKERTDGIAARNARWIGVAAVAALLAGLALFYASRGGRTSPARAPAVTDKSIAVLPLQNLSEDKENAFFADGMQDELLSNLSKIEDLKVISRTSVRQYKSGNPRNIREIGQQLGVAHVLEGTVQRTANRVKVSAQLIDAHTDAHVWSQTYDRDLVDVFAIQSEIAKTIADQLQAKLSPAEKAAIAERPTADPVAYAFYTQAKAIDDESDWEGVDRSLNRKVELLEKATQRDPNFALAYCALAKTQCDLYSVTGPENLSGAHLELAKKAADAALRVRPDFGEAHLELARYYFYAGDHTGDFDRAREELTIARRKLPNDSGALFLAARIDRRQNRWDDALANFRKAKELDPRNSEVAFWCRDTYRDMRRYNEFEQLVTKDAASGLLRDPWTQLWLAEVKFDEGDPVAAQSLLEQVPLDFSPIVVVWEIRAKVALYLRDYDAADRVIAAIPAKFADRWPDGLVAVARGDKQKAQSIFLDARKRLDARWGDKRKDAEYFARIARFDAGLGRKEEAIREARHAVDLKPIAKDSLQGPQIATTLALVYAWTGERAHALEQLEIVAKIPAGPSYGDLRFNPCWDSLRGDKRFDEIVAAAKAASTYALTPSSEKWIAVLPFENLSKGEENAFFAGGVQDEILTDLAKIADLKVISRTSVMKYKSGLERNLREIAKTLGVSHVVEGSVQRVGERVRVSAQLIDARNDTHLWAEHYDRDVADVFTVQTEIAQQIANQLKANLSPAEKAAIAERPTADPVAYAYYAKAKEIDIYSNWEGAENEKAAKQKVELLEKATQRDPNFALAYCALAKAQLDLENFELAKKAAETALRLRPDLAEGHLALARYYWLTPDSIIGVDREAAYDRARDELAIVRRMLPNNAEALLIDATIGRHQNRWDASLANLQRASELDPSNSEVAYRLEQIYFEMHRYSELEQFIRKQATSDESRTGPLEDPFNWLPMMKLAQGDPVAAQSLLDQVPPEYDPGGWIWDVRFKAALYLRDYNAANQVIAATPAKWTDAGWAKGQVARARGDNQKALAAFAAARQKMEAQQGGKPKDVDYFAGVAKLDAGLGRKEEAIREAWQVVELMPIAKDSLNGPAWVANLALVYAWTGEHDRALEQLEKVATLPGVWHDAVTYGDLLLNPCWDSLRGDKRFDKIVAAAKAAMK